MDRERGQHVARRPHAEQRRLSTRRAMHPRRQGVLPLRGSSRPGGGARTESVLGGGGRLREPQPQQRQPGHERVRCDGRADSGSGSGTKGEPAAVAGEWRTKVMLQRIPPTLDSNSVRAYLDKMGYQGRYDTIHVPMNRGSKLSMRYAFVNFHRPEDAAHCIRSCTGRPFGDSADDSFVCNADYARSQGSTVSRHAPPRQHKHSVGSAVGRR